MDIMFIVTLLLLILCAAGLYFKSKNGICRSKKRLDGKTCLVTGGTSGIGLEISIDLAMRGARLIIACPYVAEGEYAKQKIIAESGNENVIFKFLDLSSFDSVRVFAANIIANEERLDILMNNAGVGIIKQTTEDGFDVITQVNYLGHFLLTILLLPLLKKTGTTESPSRIVNTSSVMHRLPFFYPHELQNTSRCFLQRLIVYGHSKLCLLLFSRELSKRLKGSNVVINDADPGEVGTSIYFSGGYFAGILLTSLYYVFSKTPFEGAQNLLHTALDDKAGKECGRYFRGCEVCSPSAVACDDNTARSLWEETVACVQLDYKPENY